MTYPPHAVVSDTGATHPPYAIAVSANKRNNSQSADDARLLPRYRERGDLLEQRRRERQQAAVLLDTPAPELPAAPLRHLLTKPGDPRQLRGIPAIGRSVTGAIPGTDPERTTIRRAA